MNFGEVGMRSVVTVDTLVTKKRVSFRPATASDTVRVGDLVCYNSDLAADWKERTANPITGDFGSGGETTYAEGAQTYNARFLAVEKPASGNINQFAGIVVALGPQGGGDGDELDIVPLVEGAVVPVYTNASCTLDETLLGVASGSYLAQVVTGDGDPLAIGVAVETVNRSSDNGLVWCRLNGRLGVSGRGVFLEPIRPVATGYAYGVNVSGDMVFRGTAASKSYVMQISGDRESAYVATGDSNDAVLKVAGNNYAACDANFILRGLNVAINQRSGGVMGRLEGASIGAQNKSGGTVTTLIGLTVVPENYGTLTGTDVFGGIDVVMKNEAAVAATEFGLRLRNENNSIADSVHAAIIISDTGANTGWDNLFDFDDCTGTIVSEDNQAYPDKAGSLRVIMPSGGAAYINIYDGTKT